MKIGQHTLLSYLPAQVIKYVLDGKIKQKQEYPIEFGMNTATLYAELNGINKADKISKTVIKSPEYFSFIFNKFMELLINIIGKNGGDIIKFVGDALMVIWPSNEDNDDKNNLLAEKYRELASKEKNIIFGGRLAEYKYYDMDDVIKRAMEEFELNK